MRSVFLQCALLGRRVRTWIWSGWHKVALLYLAAAALVSLHSLVSAPHPRLLWTAFAAHPGIESLRFLAWFFHGALGPWAVAIVLAALIATAAAAWSARRRIVITTFANLSGDDALKNLAGQLPRRLMLELSDIAEVYAQASDDPAALSLNQIRDATAPQLSVAEDQGISDLLAAAKGEKIQLGPFSFPLDAAMTTLSAIVRGPRISGSLQTNSQGLLLEVSLSGERAQRWRVSEADLDLSRDGKTPSADVVEALIHQLAHRIYTHLREAELGTASWRAVLHHTEGMRQFQIWQQGRGDAGPAALGRAQSEFFLACREDRRFLRGRYNLGVIYYSQHQFAAAWNVFAATLQEPRGDACSADSTPVQRQSRTDLAGTHYAAAKAAQGCGNNDRAVHQCDMAIALQPAHAAAWNLKGVLAHFASPEACRCFQQAVPFSWFELCRSAWQGPVGAIAARNAALHLANLAKSHIGNSRSAAEMRQSLSLSCSDPDWLDLGRLLLAVRDAAGALAAFESAVRAKERALYWAWIACARHLLDRQPPAKDAWRRAMAVARDDNSQAKDLTQFLRDLENIETLHWIDRSPFDAWKADADALSATIAAVAKITADVASNAIAWCEGIKRLPDNSQADQAALPQTDDAALQWLLAHYADSFSARQLSAAVLQTALTNWEQQTEPSLDRFDALRSLALNALQSAPLGAMQRYWLAITCYLLRLPRLAMSEIGNALSLDPDNSNLLFLANQVTWQSIQSIPDKAEQQKGLRRIVENYSHLSDRARGDMWTMDRAWVGMACFWLARFNMELLRYPAAQQGLETAVACGYKPIESLQNLCLLHFRTGAFEDGESVYKRMIQMLHIGADPGRFRRADLLVVPNPAVPPSEELPPAANLAAASSHTAAAMAEQRLVVEAARRLRDGRRWARSLRTVAGAPMDNLRKSLAVAFLLCHGVVRLAAGEIVAPISSAAACSAEKGTENSAKQTARAANFTARRMRHLRQAIEMLTRTVEQALDQAVRADAQYRIALACQALATLDAPNAEAWRSCGLDALRNAESADRRDEYKDRIPPLRTALQAQSKPAG
ncbi:MAG: hypothetical protein WBG54_01910 [Acidobacteriaceae bacterium]